jgi:hypothetical protein
MTVLEDQAAPVVLQERRLLQTRPSRDARLMKCSSRPVLKRTPLRRRKKKVNLLFRALDAKTGLLTGLLTGIQDWKCPVALSQTCYGSKSLKVILITLWSSPTSGRIF